MKTAPTRHDSRETSPGNDTNEGTTRMKELYIGSHLSTAGGWSALLKRSHEEHGTTFAFFPRSPYGRPSKALNPSGAVAFARQLTAEHYGPLVVHAPYVYNLAGKDPDKREFAIRALAEDIRLLTPIRETGQEIYINIHPGAHVGQGPDRGCSLISDGLNRVFGLEPGIMVLLETMAGKGTEVGRSFEELACIIEGVAAKCPELSDKLGVCLDTCHVSDAGYDIIHDLDGVLDEFDRVVGIDRLHAVHINDSKNPCGAHKDRHECIGKGYLGSEEFGGGMQVMQNIVSNGHLRSLPFILETPNELAGYAAEIRLLRSLQQ